MARAVKPRTKANPLVEPKVSRDTQKFLDDLVKAEREHPGGVDPKLKTLKGEALSRYINKRLGRGVLIVVKPRVYVDSNVLIRAAVNLFGPARDDRLAKVVTGDSFVLLSSRFVVMETRPIPAYNGHLHEVSLYDRVFNRVDESPPDSALPGIIARAERLAMDHGLSAVDAIHVQCAIDMGADEFLTLEKRTRSIWRVKHPGLTFINP